MADLLIDMEQCENFTETIQKPRKAGRFYWGERDGTKRCTIMVPGWEEGDGHGPVHASVSVKIHSWDGIEDRPTFAPSLMVYWGENDEGEPIEFWHGYVIDGRMSTDLEALKAAACSEALQFFENS